MEKLYEVECQRNNITPKQFFRYCQEQFKKRTGIDFDMWVESFNDWGGDIPNCELHAEDWHEICKTKAYDWQLFLAGAYNFIMEFQFDNEKKGYGYMYAVEFGRQ